MAFEPHPPPTSYYFSCSHVSHSLHLPFAHHASSDPSYSLRLYGSKRHRGPIALRAGMFPLPPCVAQVTFQSAPTEATECLKHLKVNSFAHRSQSEAWIETSEIGGASSQYSELAKVLMPR